MQRKLSTSTSSLLIRIRRLCCTNDKKVELVVIFTRDRYVVISVRFLSPLKIESSKSQRLRLAFFVPIFRVPTQPPPSLPFCSFSSRYLDRCRVLRSRLLNSQRRSSGSSRNNNTYLSCVKITTLHLFLQPLSWTKKKTT